MFLAAIPNTPHVLGGGWHGAELAEAISSRKIWISAAIEADAVEKQEEAPPSEGDYYKNIDNVYTLLNVEPIEMEFGYSLIPWWMSHGGKLINRIVIFRRQYAQDMVLCSHRFGS